MVSYMSCPFYFWYLLGGTLGWPQNLFDSLRKVCCYCWKLKRETSDIQHIAQSLY